jgi:NAD(P)-dependent dehydrogenase (short-subunit alcohol dehydrogenase family)
MAVTAAAGAAMKPQNANTTTILGRPTMTMPALFDLSGQTALITGSSKGIGKAIAHRMAEHGANVIISSRKADVCEAAAAEINAAVGREAAVSIPANIADKASLQALVDRTLERFGRIDHLVCNAASNPYFGPSSGISDEAFTKILQNNIISNHWLITMVAPAMRARKDGTITIISSVGGLKASTVIGAYCISKAADMQLARNLAAEFGPDNVRVNCIAPGLIKTDFAKALWDNPDILKASTAGAPLRRIGIPDEIAGMAVLLAGKAGAFATGQCFVIDGGATIA